MEFYSGKPENLAASVMDYCNGVLTDNFMLYVELDPEDGFIWRVWTIPAMELEDVTMKKKGKLIVTPNPSLTSSNRYGKWRRADIGEVERTMINWARSVAAGPIPPIQFVLRPALPI